MPKTCKQDNSETVSNIVTDYIAGMSMANIGKKYDLHPFKVAGVLYAKNIVGKIVPMRQYKKYTITDEMKENIISLYNNGNPIISISKELGIPQYRVRKILLQNNIEIRKSRPSGQLKMERNRKIYQEYIGSDTTEKEIAEKYGISPERVRQIIKVVDFQFGD